MIGWAVETLIASSVLMVLVLALRGPARRAFGPGIAYALWSLPVLRMLLPPLPGDWQLSRLVAPFTRAAVEAPGVVVGVLNPATLPPGIDAAATVDFSLAGHHAAMALVPPTPIAGAPNLALLVLGLWAIGALAFLGYHLITHSRYCRHLLRRACVDRTVAQGRVRVIETDGANGPLAFGVFRKYVAFPRDFGERYDEVERDLALAHELGHHVRGDLIANWVALVTLALHWFNPIAWKAFRAFRADQEMACDALVLAGRAPALRHAYGRAIVKSAHGGAVSAACHLHTINELKGRLRMLSHHQKTSRRRLAAGTLGIGAVTLAALGLTASGTQAAETVRASVERVTGVELAALDAPKPPRPPEPPQVAELPEPPPPPAPPEAPSAPDGATTTETVTIDKDGRKTVTRTVRREVTTETTDAGKSISRTRTTVHSFPDVRVDLADLPEVRSLHCGSGDEMVRKTREGGKQVTVICTDRIEARAAAAATIASARADKAVRMAMVSRQHGVAHALNSLKLARRTIEVQPSLSAEQRATALEGIDDSIREMESARSDD
jgi:beta-lactamase regulating signal transducer with metallopeptidase domain